MGIRLYIILLVVLALCYSCNKENGEAAQGFGMKLVQTENYNLRANFLDYEGNSVVASVGNENEAGAFAYGILPAVIYKFDKQNGGLIWATDLPGIVHNLWKAIPLRNGNICVVGMDSLRSSQNVGLAIINPNGEIVTQHTFFQQLNSSTETYISRGLMDCIELNNGNIALVSARLIGTNDTGIQIFEFDQQLNLVLERIYSDSQASPYVLSICQDQNDFIYFLSGNEISGQEYLPKIVKVNGGDLELVSSTPTKADLIYLNTSNLLYSPDGFIMWFSSKEVFGSTSQVNLRNQEVYETYDTLLLSRYQIDNESMAYTSITGFPNNGYISKIIPSSQGGYIAVGTCNVVNENVAVTRYRVLLIKLDRQLNVEWMEDFDAQYTSVLGHDIVEVPGGYQIGATHYSISGFNMPILLRADYSGQLY